MLISGYSSIHPSKLPIFACCHDEEGEYTSEWEHSTIIIDSCAIKAEWSEADSYETQLAKILSEAKVWWLTRPWPPHHVVFTSCCLTERESSRSVQRHSYQLKRFDSSTLWGPFFLLYYNRYYWQSICKWQKIKLQWQIVTMFVCFSVKQAQHIFWS